MQIVSVNGSVKAFWKDKTSLSVNPLSKNKTTKNARCAVVSA